MDQPLRKQRHWARPDKCRSLPVVPLAWLAWCAVLLLLPGMAVADPRQDTGFGRAAPAAHHKDDVHYKYQYAVDDPVSGVVNDRWEQRSGDFVKGQYSLLDPDGKVRIVDYEVDGERGFHAVIHTRYPAPSLLSIQSASQVHEVYQDSPVNIRAKNGLDIPEFALRNPRFSVRDNLPFNYHALDAAKIGLNTEDDGAQLQSLVDLKDLEPPLSPREAQRRKFHRDNHLLPHERLQEQQDLQGLQQADLAVQQDTRQDLQDVQEPQYHTLDRRIAYPLTAPTAPGSVFNPRAAYISLRPRPTALSPLPPPNPPPMDVHPSHRRGAAPLATPAYLFQPAPVTSLASSLTSTTRLVASRGSSRPRLVQHLTETSPGLSASRSYYLR
ncbi:uncharacterized protein LOC117643896 [Thrips palmi]|uniref:Uncharacterized protein LOC117643896 n=1 Tax=Thrips palmi TaxID=161013 RepID=A0A6P8YGS6_THRPL|nr:uncharacterized protein LOC117643896 [Thrips palmi]